MATIFFLKRRNSLPQADPKTRKQTAGGWVSDREDGQSSSNAWNFDLRRSSSNTVSSDLWWPVTNEWPVTRGEQNRTVEN